MYLWYTFDKGGRYRFSDGLRIPGKKGIQHAYRDHLFPSPLGSLELILCSCLSEAPSPIQIVVQNSCQVPGMTAQILDFVASNDPERFVHRTATSINSRNTYGRPPPTSTFWGAVC